MLLNCLVLTIHLHVKLRNRSLQVGKYNGKEQQDLQEELQDEHKQPQESKLLSRAPHTMASKSVVDTCHLENEFIKCSNWDTAPRQVIFNWTGCDHRNSDNYIVPVEGTTNEDEEHDRPLLQGSDMMVVRGLQAHNMPESESDC